MRAGLIQYKDVQGRQKEYTYSFLSHDEFCYFIRLENSSLEIKQVTIRLFLAPYNHREDRRAWIEMDKFVQELKPNSKTVIFRRDTESSVIRKPAVKDPAKYNSTFDPTNIPVDDRLCSCGWPYHMLLPKGQNTDKGMAFVLMLMVTD